MFLTNTTGQLNIITTEVNARNPHGHRSFFFNASRKSVSKSPCGTPLARDPPMYDSFWASARENELGHHDYKTD